MQECRAFLKDVILFQDLPDSELDAVCLALQRRRVERHEVIFNEGDPGDALYIIRKGLVKINKGTADGRTKTLALLKKGEVFGEMSVLSNEGRSASAEAMLECELMVMEKAAVMALLRTDPEISLRIIRTLISRLTDADRQIKNLALGNSRARVADILLQLGEQFGQAAHSSTKLAVRLTHQEIADLAGLARETTTKLLSEFVKSDAIALADKEIEILNIGKLKEWML
jgi:CRP/FNR family cyclic AMP-dependent transcriptional regulator